MGLIPKEIFLKLALEMVSSSSADSVTRALEKRVQKVVLST